MGFSQEPAASRLCSSSCLASLSLTSTGIAGVHCWAQFLHGDWDLNSAVRSYTEGTLTAETSAQPQTCCIHAITYPSVLLYMKHVCLQTLSKTIYPLLKGSLSFYV